jgi:hypothetical protein
MEKQLEIPRKMKKPKQTSRPSSAQPGHAPAPPDRWVPPVSGGSLPHTRALSLSLPSGAGLSAPVAFARAPLFPLSLVGPPRQCTESLPPHAGSLSRCVVGPPCELCLPRARRGPASACTPRSPATSLAHTPQLLFEHHPRPHSLSRPSSHSLALSRALPTLLDLASDPRPSCRSSSPPEAAPGYLELCLEVRHPFPCSVFPIVLCCWPISASLEVGRGGPPHPHGGRPNWLGSVPPRRPLAFPSPC